MFRFLLLILFSCSVIASQEDTKIYADVLEIQEKLLATNSYFDALNNKVESAITENGKLIEENSRLVNELNLTINSQNKSQVKFVELLSDLKKVKEKTTDLEFEIATDVPYVITVALSILASVLITWLLLRRDSNSSHNRLVREFRQKWVNDFRDTICSYVDIASQIETYQKNNLSFYLSRHSLIKLREQLDEKLNEIDQTGLERASVVAKREARK